MRSFPAALEENIFFAGYCGPEFSYTWLSNEEISIVCDTNEAQGIQTTMSLFQGVTVHLEFPADR